MDIGTGNATATGTAPPSPASRPSALPREPSRTRWAQGRFADAVVVLAPAMLAGALCLVGITSRSLGFDESATATIASQHGAALRAAIAHDGGNMSGYYVLVHALVTLFGRGLLVVRLPSAIAVALAVAATALVGLRLFGRRTALIAALLTALSVSLVFWGQSARSYALLVAFSSASFVAFIALVRNGLAGEDGQAPAGRGGWKAWVAYVVLSTLAMYMSLMAALVVVAQLATFAWWRRRRGWAVVSAVASVAVLSIPLALLALDRGSGQLSWVSRPAFPDIEQVLEAVTGAGLQPSIRPTATTLVLLWPTVAGLLAVAAAIVASWRRRGVTPATFGPSLLLSWLAVPLMLAWAESLVAQPLFLPRNLLYCAPPAALLLAWGLTRVMSRGGLTTDVPGRWGRSPSRVAALAAAGLVALIALRALQVAPSYGVSPEDWRGATAYVLRQARPGDCVMFYPSDGRMAFQYYLSNRVAEARFVPRSVLPATPWSQVRTYVEEYVAPPPGAVTKLPSSCTRLWFISTHQGRRHGSPAARADYRRYRELRAELEAGYAEHLVRLFGYASAVRVELLG